MSKGSLKPGRPKSVLKPSIHGRRSLPPASMLVLYVVLYGNIYYSLLSRLVPKKHTTSPKSFIKCKNNNEILTATQTNNKDTHKILD